MSPFGSDVSIELGVRVGDHADTVAYGRFRVAGAELIVSADKSSATLFLVDVAARTANYRFESPYVMSGGDLETRVVEVLSDRGGVVASVDGGAAVTVRERVLGLDPEVDPWRELQDVVAAYARRLYYDRDGTLIIGNVSVPPLSEAVSLSGTYSLVTAYEGLPGNVAVVRGQSTDPAVPPVQAVVMDDDPTSPTYAGATPDGSPYGRVTRFLTSPLITTVGQAENAALSMLAREKAAGASWQVTVPYNPTLDCGDLLAVVVGGETVYLLVDAVSLDLFGPTELVCRQVVISE